MSGELGEAATAFAAALPASVELPAGAGKTHLLAATVRYLVDAAAKVLVLTHTNAGVHVIQGKLKDFGVASGARVSTLTSFAFLLARAYPQIGELKVPSAPNWSDSANYITAAARICSSDNIRQVLEASYTHMLVDEYQDCSESQHAFVCTLAQAIPATGILGDPMQAIFGFGDTTLVAWDVAIERFPPHVTVSKPWRWVGHNEKLGAWLLQVREDLKPGTEIDFSHVDPAICVKFRSSASNHQAVADAALKTQWPAGESVLVISTWKNMARKTAANLRGVFTVMEEIAGDFMAKRLTGLAQIQAEAYGSWLLALIKACTCGHQKLDTTIKNAVSKGRTTGHLARTGLEEAIAALDAVVTNPCFATLSDAMDSIPKAKSLQLHSDEAWYDIQAALRGAIAAGNDPTVLTAALARARDRVRHQGRRNRSRVVSRTVLVKGLEYDHVIISNIQEVTDVNNLYVALTRARKSITVIGASPSITIS